MITFYLITCLSVTLINNVSGNIFSPFSSFPGFSSFPSFPNPFGSLFGSSYPYSQSYGSPFSSGDPFSSSPFPFQGPSSPFFPSPSTRPVSSSSSPFSSPFNRGFPGFPSFPSFPSFNDLTKGFGNGDLKGNGIKITSTSSGSNAGVSPGQVIQTIKVEKIGTANGPGEERRIVQTIRATGPVIATTGSNPNRNQTGQNQSNRQNQRQNGQRPTRPNNTQQQWQPSRPTTTPIVPPTGPTTTLVAPSIRPTINITQPAVPQQSTGPINQSVTSTVKSGGVTVRRVNSSGQIIN